jgi:hypothetical protein
MADSNITAFTDGSPLQAADEFVVARSGANYKIPGSALGAIFSGARAYSSTNISVPNNTLTAIALDSERFDTDSYHEGVTNPTRFTIPATGYYLVGGCVFWAGSSAGWRSIRLRVNATTDIVEVAYDPARADGDPQAVTTLWHFTAADYVEMLAFQTSGGALSIFGSGSTPDLSPEFWIVRVG